MAFQAWRSGCSSIPGSGELDFFLQESLAQLLFRSLSLSQGGLGCSGSLGSRVLWAGSRLPVLSAGGTCQVQVQVCWLLNCIGGVAP